MKYKLKDIITFKPGYAFKKSDMTDTGIELVKIGNLKNNKVIIPSGVKIKEDTKFKDFIINKGDILMALTGDPVYKGSIQTWVGRTSMYLNNKVAYLNQRVCKLMPNEKIILNDYLYYWLIRHDKTYEIAGLFHGSANQANISHKEVGEMFIELPSLEIQKKASKILSDIDKKINLNNEINNNLHDLAEQQFNEFYLTGVPQKLEELLSNISAGSRPKGGAQKSGIPSIGAEKIEKFGVYDYSSEKYISEEYYDKLKKGRLNSGDVLLYKDGAYTGKVSMCLNGFPYTKAAINEHVFILNTRNNWAQNYLYFSLYNKDTKEILRRLASSKAAQPGLNQEELKSVEIQKYNKEGFNRFSDLVSDNIKIIQENKKSNEQLEKLRDTLLPKLMNGEIDLENIEI